MKRPLTKPILEAPEVRRIIPFIQNPISRPNTPVHYNDFKVQTYKSKKGKNMTIQMTIFLSVVSVAFAIYLGMTTISRNKTCDDKNEATQLTTVIVKLENIGTGIARIESDMNNIKSDIKEDRERLVKVEESTKSAHKRLDICEKNCTRISTTS